MKFEPGDEVRYITCRQRYAVTACNVAGWLVTLRDLITGAEHTTNPDFLELAR